MKIHVLSGNCGLETDYEPEGNPLFFSVLVFSTCFSFIVAEMTQNQD